MTIEVLQLCPLLPTLEAALAERFQVHRWFDTADAGLSRNSLGGRIRAVVTGGHIGLPTDLAAMLPALEIVAINGVGFDKVDLSEARRRSYRVTNTPDILTEDVADLAVGLVPDAGASSSSRVTGMSATAAGPRASSDWAGRCRAGATASSVSDASVGRSRGAWTRSMRRRLY